MIKFGMGLLTLATTACAPAPLAAVRTAYRALDAASTRQSTTLTVYAGGRARVQDVRAASLPATDASLRFPDVSNQLDAATVRLRALDGGPLEVLEQAYDPGSLGPTKALAAYVGQQVQVRLPAEGAQPAKLVTATLVSQDGPLVRIDGKLYLKPPGELVLPDVPAGLEPTPTLSWRVRAHGAGRFEATYMTGGLSWQAHYELGLAADASHGQLEAWAVVANDTAVGFPGAHVIAVAGRLGTPGGFPFMARAEAAPAPMAPTQTSATDEFHRYDLGQDLALPAGQTRQWPLLAARSVDLTKRYRFESYAGGTDEQPRATRVRIELAALDVPLATGRFQVAGPDGALVGQAEVGDMAAGEPIRLDVSAASDVVGQHVQTAVHQLAGKAHEESYAVTLRNHKPGAVTVDVIEHPSGDWSLTAQSLPGTRVSATELAFKVPVPAGGEAKLTYTVTIKDPA